MNLTLETVQRMEKILRENKVPGPYSILKVDSKSILDKKTRKKRKETV